MDDDIRKKNILIVGTLRSRKIATKRAFMTRIGPKIASGECGACKTRAKGPGHLHFLNS